MVTDYKGHRQTLFPVWEINLRAYADAILTQITWPALEFESRAMHRQPAKPSAYRAKPWRQGVPYTLFSLKNSPQKCNPKTNPKTYPNPKSNPHSNFKNIVKK